MKLDVKTDKNGGYHICSDSFRLQAKVLPAVLWGGTLQPNSPLSFRSIGTEKTHIGPLEGSLSRDVALQEGLEYRREIFVSGDKKACGIRLHVKNLRTAPIELESLYPLFLQGKEGLKLYGEGMEHWRFLKTCRQKTDVPGSFSFTEMDENFEDAALEGGKIKAGGGVTGNHGDFLNLDEIYAEPFFTIKHRNRETLPGVFFGIIGQSDHLTTFTIRQEPGTAQLKSISCNCEFDGVQVDVGEVRSTHWMIITAFEDEGMMRESFTEIAAQALGIEPPKRSPLTVFCTWQFYGMDFCSADLDELLQSLREKPLPIDVIQLDNGWMDLLGDYNAGHRFPEGMKAVADKIRAAGYIPGIWTCPTMIRGQSEAAGKYPDLIAKKRDGQPLAFDYIEGDAFALDPTAPGYLVYMKEVYGKLRAWGYTYHKTDFLRSIILNENIQFHNRKVNRARAYRLAGEVLREVLGEECYIVSCGGINDAGNAGIYDSIRATNDMFGFWTPPDGARWKGTLIKVKQGIIRNYVNRLIRTDPDACPIRRRTEPFRPGVLRDDLSLGLFNDEEAFTVVLCQYTGGGNCCICERFRELDEDRRSLFRHFIPSMGIPARALDFTTARCPNFFQTDIIPKAGGLQPWWTLAVGNWHDEERELEIDLGKCRLPANVEQLAVFEFHDQTFYGLKKRGDRFSVAIPAHGMRLFRLAEWDGQNPILLGTDLHFSGGGIEIAEIQIRTDRLEGRIETSWTEYPVTVYAAFPASPERAIVCSRTLARGEKKFLLDCPFNASLS